MPAEMEHWRSFFAQAESDLWTIIHHAILIAASDFPAEFRHKRCEIAEILFTRRPSRCPPAGSIDATRLSESVITNATKNEEKDPYHAGRDKFDDVRHGDASSVETRLADTQFQGTLERCNVQSEKCNELDAHLESCNASGDHPNPKDLAMDHVVLQGVSMIKDQIMDSANQSEGVLLRSLHALEQLDITVEILKATDIGREVNKHRRHSSALVRNLVKQLVRKWKGMVDEWVKNAEAEPSLNASGEQEGFDRDVLCTNSQADVSRHMTTQLMQRTSVQESSNKPITDSASAVRSHLHTDHVVEEMGSSRVESDDLYRPGYMERKVDSCGKQAQCNKSIVTKTAAKVIGSEKFGTSIMEAGRSFLSETVACGRQKCLEDKVGHLDEYGGSHKTGQGKTLLAQNFSSANNYDRTEIIKKRLLSEVQHAEHAKKQRDMPPASSAPEPYKRGVVGSRLPGCV